MIALMVFICTIGIIDFIGTNYHKKQDARIDRAFQEAAGPSVRDASAYELDVSEKCEFLRRGGHLKGRVAKDCQDVIGDNP